MKLGISLAGGGVKGAAHIGVLKAFEENNIKIDYISGTSSGSIVAALYAIGYNADEIYGLFKRYCKKIKYIDFWYLLKLIGGSILKRKLIIEGLNSGRELENIIKNACMKKGVTNINEIKIPLIIPSVDLYNGTVYCFSSVKNKRIYCDEIKYENHVEIWKAVRASCSYPGVFVPYKYKNTELIDGGVRENVPWKEIKKIGADKVVSVVFEETKKCKCKNIIEIVSGSLDILSHELSNYELMGADYLLKIRTKDVSLLDVNQIDYLYNIGYKTTIGKLKELKNM